MMAGFAIKSNRVLLPDGLQPATVVVQGELIESIHPHDFTPPDVCVRIQKAEIANHLAAVYGMAGRTARCRRT